MRRMIAALRAELLTTPPGGRDSRGRQPSSRTGTVVMDEPIACPHCGAPAQITERFWLGSTAGPVEGRSWHISTPPG
jgi:hypothetical protein